VIDRWHHVGVLFERALEVPPERRAAWVRDSGEPEDVQREVLSLLEAHEGAGAFLETSAIDDEPARTSPGVATGAQPAIDADPLPPDFVVGPYRIVRLIGQGGMGVVYEAEDTRLHRRVALKSLPKRLAGNERLRLRLRHEARAAAALTHPFIATVYALEELDEGVFIASEFVEGHTLRDEMEQGALPIDRAVATARDVASALVAAHDRGIVHRDLKPENVLRAIEGRVKVLDFGLAQFDASAEHLAPWTRLTETGLVVGTPPYMAPEQLLGRPTDARTDQFSLGVMLYEMVCGRHPFGGASLPSTIARILADEPEPPPDPSVVPVALWSLIERCLKKDPADRFPTMAEVIHGLDALGVATTPALGKPPASAADAGVTGERARRVPTAGSRPLSSRSAGAMESARWWWQFHQLAAALIYWFMVWPAWHVHHWIRGWGLLFFVALLASVIVAANLRLHLWFSSRIYPGELAAQQAEVASWIRWADWTFSVTLAAGAVSLGEGRAAWAAVLFAFAVGGVVAFLIIEPTTARAAFGRRASADAEEL
jgi:tRNA A-37 threonylcarbamoyl transferase component Bud32